MIHNQALVYLPSGLDAIIAELKTKGFSSVVSVHEETGLEGLSGGGLHTVITIPTVDRTAPCLLLLLGFQEVMMALAATSWDNATILVGPVEQGADVFAVVEADPALRAVYDSLIPPHLPYLDADGVETEETTNTPNPLAGQMRVFCRFA
jgi:hypothetical protein